MKRELFVPVEARSTVSGISVAIFSTRFVIQMGRLLMLMLIVSPFCVVSCSLWVRPTLCPMLARSDVLLCAA
jgi:hypothetical protein